MEQVLNIEIEERINEIFEYNKWDREIKVNINISIKKENIDIEISGSFNNYEIYKTAYKK